MQRSPRQISPLLGLKQGENAPRFKGLVCSTHPSLSSWGHQQICCTKNSCLPWPAPKSFFVALEKSAIKRGRAHSLFGVHRALSRSVCPEARSSFVVFRQLFCRRGWLLRRVWTYLHSPSRNPFRAPGRFLTRAHNTNRGDEARGLLLGGQEEQV